jgi:hypothetical protein
VDFTLAPGNPNPDLIGVVCPAWVYLKRSTTVSGVSTVLKIGSCGPGLDFDGFNHAVGVKAASSILGPARMPARY